MQHKASKPIPQEQKTFKHITVMYVTALLIVAVVSIVSQVEVQRYLSSQANDSHVINFAARLRTYSQTLSKTALLLESGRNTATNRKEFVNTLKQWQRSYQGLKTGSDFLNLPVNDRNELENMFDIIRAPQQEIWAAANRIVAELERNQPLDPRRIHPFVEIILAHEQAYLIGMELMVFDYDRFSQNRVRELKKFEYLLLGFVLITLALEVVFIFYPSSIRIRRIVRGLIASEETARQLAEQVQESGRLIEKSHGELRDVNFALEKATYLIKTDQHGRIIYANDKYCHITKYTMSELRNQLLFNDPLGEQESSFYEHLRDPVLKQEVWQGEIFDHASDGTGIWLDVTLIPVIDNTGRVYQYLGICNDITKRKNTERELWLLTEEKMRRQEMEQKIRAYGIVNGQEKERKRVATEIHDGIGQMLTSLRMKIEQIDDRRAHSDAEIGQVNTLLASIITETKRICSDLLPSVLDDFGLRSAIHELLKMCRETAQHITFHLEENLTADALPKELEIGVFRIAQEALNNAIKHASASQIEVHIDSNAQFLNLMIRDDGKGFYFDSQRLVSRELVQKASGLRNMQERADLLGGTFTISSEPGSGTIIQLEIPLLK